MVAAAALGAAAIGAAGSMYSSSKASGASSKANAIIQGNVKPYLTAGTNAVNDLSDPNALMKGFQTSPGYQFRMQQGLNAVGQDKAVNGLLRSGGAVKALNNYAQGQASSEFGNYVAQKQFLANEGLQSQGLSANATEINAANQGNSAIAQGNAFSQFGGSAIDAIMAKYGGTGSAGTASSYG